MGAVKKICKSLSNAHKSVILSTGIKLLLNLGTILNIYCVHWSENWKSFQILVKIFIQCVPVYTYEDSRADLQCFHSWCRANSAILLGAEREHGEYLREKSTFSLLHFAKIATPSLKIAVKRCSLRRFFPGSLSSGCYPAAAHCGLLFRYRVNTLVCSHSVQSKSSSHKHTF